MSLLVYGLLAWLMPQTYSNRFHTILDNRTQKFVSELEQVAFSNSGGLFDPFVQDMEINSVELYNGNGDFVPLPTAQFNNEWEEWEVSIAQATDDAFSENAPVLSNYYYFSFSNSNEHYLLIVYGTAEQIAGLQQSFVHVFPLILFAVLTVAFAVSWLYSCMITKPMLAISHISEKMSDLQLDWKVEEQRTDRFFC